MGDRASSRLPPSPTSQSISQASGALTWGAEAGLPRHGFVMRVYLHGALAAAGADFEPVGNDLSSIGRRD